MSIFQTIKFRIITLGVMLLVAGVFVRLFIALPFAQELLRDLVAKQQLSIASYVAREIEHSIQTRRALIGELGASLPPELLLQPGELALWVRARQRVNPLFDNGLLVIRPDGNGLFAQYPVVAGRDQLLFTDSDWFQAALRADTSVMSKPYHGRANGAPILIMAAPVHDAAKNVVAVVAGVVALNTAGFLDRLQEVRLGATGGFLLVSPADKLYVGASEPDIVLTPTPAPGMDLLHDRAMSGYRGSGITNNVKGVEELASIATVHGTGWFVVARMPTAEVFQPVAAMRIFYWKGALGILVVMGAALMLLLPSILRPLTVATRSMREMADGKRPLAPLPIQRQDEVGDLLTGFNYLVRQLHKKDASLRASEMRLEFLAHHDALTGLYNRAMLDDHLQQALAHAERSGTSFALLFCDLDNFKPINDQCGHAVGDLVLRRVADILSEGRRQTDTVARLGGDEFVVLLSGLDDAHSAAIHVAQQLLAAIAIPFEIEGNTLTLGVSIGITLYQGLQASPSQLLSQADIAMYRAKREGKHGFCIFDEGMEALNTQHA
ncbi:MAG: diguanylate cyclase [bacterium]